MEELAARRQGVIDHKQVPPTDYEIRQKEFFEWSKNTMMDKVIQHQNTIAMTQNKQLDVFLSKYNEQVFNNAHKLRKVILEHLPDIIEQIDLNAKMIAYCYGQKYVQMICTLIPSKKGLKLAFYNGVNLPDPHNILEGKAKLSRYVEINFEEQIQSHALKQLIKDGLKAYKERVK